MKIPDSVIDLLSLGKTRGCGSFISNPTNILQVDDLFENFQGEARKQKNPELTIAKIKAFSILTSLHIDECKTNDSRVKDFKKFLKEHQEQMFLQIDKGPNLIFIDKKTYHQKLNNLLDNQFEKLPKYDDTDLKKDLYNYRELLKRTFEGCLPLCKIAYLFPKSSLSDFYGYVKNHKENSPVRGICTSYNSLVANAENFIMTLLAPLNKKCEFSIKNN